MTVPLAEYKRGASLPSSNPFQRLAALIADIEPLMDPIIMSIGEPQHALPDFTASVLADNIADFRRYPAMNGTPEFRSAVGSWLDKRFHLDGLLDTENGIAPLNGSREGLSFGPIFARDYLGKTDETPVVVMPNPFYQTYAAGAHIADAQTVLMDAIPEHDFLPNLDSLSSETLDRTIAFYVASPSNPEGSVATIDYMQRLIGLARKHNFIIFADECYSEIYRDVPPPGMLEAAKMMAPSAGEVFDKIVVLNSLSKRSNLAGLRCGFAAGDPVFIKNWVRFRGLAAPQIPLPIQAVATRAYSDEGHVIENRRLYNEKYALAEKLLSPLVGKVTPDAGFFLWLNVKKWGDSVSVTKTLYRDTGVKVIPGSYLATNHADGTNPGHDFIRVGLCPPLETTEEALTRLATWLGGKQ
ncbi:MAG: aminotransferase class I/II-fold pyridoxal phosphate-dependent enzyme [Rhodobacteraceae bacterium]|nr:aminotransferase class I/II-fold pyridoxal phosphate-dependent enzyme [Paracoccaceae bacterium]